MGRALGCKAVYTWWPSKDVFAAGVIEVDLSQIVEGQNFIVKWRGKPVFVRKRTAEMIAEARKDDAIVSSLRDPSKDTDRAPRAEWLVAIGFCTHLGCIPYPDQGLYPNGGYFARATGPITTAPAAFARVRPRRTSTSRTTPSWMTTRSAWVKKNPVALALRTAALH